MAALTLTLTLTLTADVRWQQRRQLFAEQNRTRHFENSDKLITDDVEDVFSMGGKRDEAFEMRQQIYRRIRGSLWRTEMTATQGTRVKVKIPKTERSDERENIKIKMFCAGGLAGGVAKTVGAPLSRATIEMQTSATLGKKSTSLFQLMR